ncbi:unnamed protein product [Trichobilharzia regenti]|nr:unnamed protein product [Trichobilharzia regenti]
MTGEDKKAGHKGGGAGGSIREAGGSLGKREATLEDEYFRRLVNYNNTTNLKKNILYCRINKR